MPTLMRYNLKMANAMIEFAADAVTPGLQHQATFRVRKQMGMRFEGLHARVTGELEQLAESRAAGRIPIQDFKDEYASHLRSVADDVFRQGKRIATGRPDAYLTKQNRADVQKYLDSQDGYIRRFAAELGNERYDPKTPEGLARIRWRAGMYADRLEGLANQAFKRAAPEQLAVWMLGEAEHCPDCVAEASKGARPLGRFRRLPGEGRTICLTNCQCYLELITPGTRKNIQTIVTEPARF